MLEPSWWEREISTFTKKYLNLFNPLVADTEKLREFTNETHGLFLVLTQQLHVTSDSQ